MGSLATGAPFAEDLPLLDLVLPDWELPDFLAGVFLLAGFLVDDLLAFVAIGEALHCRDRTVERHGFDTSRRKCAHPSGGSFEVRAAPDRRLLAAGGLAAS